MSEFEYACGFELNVERGNKWGEYQDEVLEFVSENRELYDMIDFSADFYFEHPELEKLPDGDYWVYVRGIAEFESDVNWESGIDEGHFILGVEKIRIVPIELQHGGDGNDV